MKQKLFSKNKIIIRIIVNPEWKLHVVVIINNYKDIYDSITCIGYCQRT